MLFGIRAGPIDGGHVPVIKAQAQRILAYSALLATKQWQCLIFKKILTAQHLPT